MSMSMLHLLWIIPLSILVGVAILICWACVVVGVMADEEEIKLRKKEQENDN